MTPRAASPQVATASMPIHLLSHLFEYDSPHFLEPTLLCESLDFQSLRRGQ